MSLQANKLSLSIAGKTICSDLDVCFNPGEFWGIMGVNGVGKTTLLHTLIGLRTINNAKNNSSKNSKPETGYITLQQININDFRRIELAKRIGMMLQEYEYNFPSTVIEATLIGRHPFINGWQMEGSHDKQLAINALKKVGLENFHERSVNSLSGGEKRRLNLATLLTQDPDYYLLDEPVNHLDIKAQLEILDLLKEKFALQEQCGVMVIHDPNLAYRFCDHILLLFNDGQWLSGKTKDILTRENLSRLYNCPIHLIKDAQHRLFVPLKSSSSIES